MPALLPSFRKQQRVLDFTAIQRDHPEGVYITLNPDHPSTWAGVLFVHEGPYESAVLRYEIQFPVAFPEQPPVVTFSTDIFHPLIVPLTQYTFNAGDFDTNGTVSTSDQDRLPPGAFSLRYGFPSWFRRGGSKRSSLDNEVKHDTSENYADVIQPPSVAKPDGDSRDIILQLLRHLKQGFEDPVLLDNLPFNSVGNPSAWHAWRAYRGLSKDKARGRSPTREGNVAPSPSSAKQMSDWNWDGVWESRVRNAVESSISEAGLYTNQGLVRFAKLDSNQLREIRQQILTS